jgi:hypothetical protein
MSDEATARLGLPLLQSGQAQKEVTHNEALALLDLAVDARVLAAGINDPPVNPAPGDCWIIGPAPTGDWSGMADHLAGWTADGWCFVAPLDGMLTWVADSDLPGRFTAAGWMIGELRGSTLLIDGTQVVAAQAAAIADPAGGTVVDSEARDVLGEILAMLRVHGLIAS